MKRDEQILVSWVSFHSDPYLRQARTGHYVRDERGELTPGPALELLTNECSPFRRTITRAYFLARSGPEDEGGRREKHPRELDVFADLARVLKERAPTLVVEPLIWETRDPPTAYGPLLKHTVDSLRRLRRDHPEATIIVNLSPGTPQMHTTLLVALSARCAGERVVAVQGIPRDKRTDPSRIIDEVPWDLLGRLNVDESRPKAEAARASWRLEDARSPALRELLARLDEAARVPFPVLIHGGRGSGKTRVAERLRALYLAQRGRVGEGSWDLRINCAALHRELLLSELFGHSKGAFTGAHRKKEGLLERARGDCIFLDEVHHLDADAQAKLLVALERRGEFRALGDDRPKRSDFRLISATNRPLSDLRKDLLPDFWDRTSDFILRVPELRECKDDLDGMWRSAFRDACDDVAATRIKHSQGIDAHAERLFSLLQPEHHQAVLHVLELHSLPGNWRDLQRLARRVLARILGDSSMLASECGPFQRLLEDPEGTSTSIDVVNSPGSDPRFEDALPSLELLEARIREAKTLEVPIRELCSTLELRLMDAVVRVGGSDRAGAKIARMAQRTFGTRHRELRSRLNKGR